MITRSVIRLGLCLVLVSLMSACSAVPDRYAPWRDNDVTTNGRTPNLGDVPAPPNVDNAKAQIDEMRTRMEADRQNAYMSAQGLVPQDTNALPAASTPPPISPSAPISSNELAPLTTPPSMAPNVTPPVQQPPQEAITSTNLPDAMPQAAVQQQNPQMSGNVYYNYDPTVGNDYNYGYNAQMTQANVQLTPPAQLVASTDLVSNDPSIAIDLSVLGGSSSASSTMRVNHIGSGIGGISAGEPIAYFAHGSAKLAAKDRTAIRNLAGQLKQRPQPVMLAGNASKRTGIRNTALSREINLKMSERRAKVVMDELITQGVSPEQIYISAYGDAVPNRREDNGHNEAANRRVEVLFDQ